MKSRRLLHQTYSAGERRALFPYRRLYGTMDTALDESLSNGAGCVGFARLYRSLNGRIPAVTDWGYTGRSLPPPRFPGRRPLSLYRPIFSLYSRRSRI